jgi:hypothetical protein
MLQDTLQGVDKDYFSCVANGMNAKGLVTSHYILY